MALRQARQEYAEEEAWPTEEGMEDAAAAKEELDGWIKWAQYFRIKVFVKLQRKICRHYNAILATMEHHLSNAVPEATNRQIALSVYMAYGFRNIDNMIALIMLRCSDIDARLPWEYQAASWLCLSTHSDDASQKKRQA